MKILKFLLPLLLVACGPKGDNSGPRTGGGSVPNADTIAVLVNYEPLQGSHIPYVRHLMFNNLNKFTYIYFVSQTYNVSSLLEFMTTPLGQKLVGGLFQNGKFLSGPDLYLWFVLQSNPTETLEYKLELYQNGTLLNGYESIKIGSNPETKIKVTYTTSPWYQ